MTAANKPDTYVGARPNRFALQIVCQPVASKCDPDMNPGMTYVVSKVTVSLTSSHSGQCSGN